MNTTKIQIPSEFSELNNKKWRYFAIYGGRGGVKSHTVARFLLIKGLESKCRILATRELQKSIKDSVHKLLSDLITEYNLSSYEVMKDSIRNRETGSEFIFTGIRNNSAEIKSMEGIDYCWVEESQAITEQSLNVLTPTIRKPGSQIIFTYNRLTDLDPVHVRFVMKNNPDTCVINVNYDVAEKYGWFPDVLRKEMEADKANPVLFAHKWLGEPLGQAEMSVIGRDSILAAMQREVPAEGADIYGIDVARMGNDRTVIVHRKGFKVIRTKELNKLTLTQAADEIQKFVGFDKEVEIRVDGGGLGIGLYDMLKKERYNAIDINFGNKASDPDKYPNWISEAWFHLESIIDSVQLEYNSDLLMELSTRQWRMDNKGRRTIESKNEYKKRGFRSPDYADAICIAFAAAKKEPIRIIF